MSQCGAFPQDWDHTITRFSHIAGLTNLPTASTVDLTSPFPSLWVVPLSDYSLGVDSGSEAIEQKGSIFKIFTEIARRRSRKVVPICTHQERMRIAIPQGLPTMNIEKSLPVC